MNWLYIGLPLLGLYLIWFGYLLWKGQYSKSLLLFAFAHFPHLLVNLVAPFRGALDPDYAGYTMGWITLPKGILVPLVVGFIVISCLILASRAMVSKMVGWWTFAFLFDLFLTIAIAIPILWDVATNFSAYRLELGEYLQISGFWVGLIFLLLFTGPTLFACYFAGKQTIIHFKTPQVQVK